MRAGGPNSESEARSLTLTALQRARCRTALVHNTSHTVTPLAPQASEKIPDVPGLAPMPPVHPSALRLHARGQESCHKMALQELEAAGISECKSLGWS